MERKYYVGIHAKHHYNCKCKNAKKKRFNDSFSRNHDFKFLGHERASAWLVASKDGVCFVLFCFVVVVVHFNIKSFSAVSEFMGESVGKPVGESMG